MIEPTGYTALDLIGFTDRGGYDPDAYYVKNDIATVGNTKWRCLIDDTHNVTPTEGANWTIYLESATSLAGMSDVTLTSPKNGDGLVHDGNDWKNIPIMTKEQWKKNGAYNICPNNATTQVVGETTFTVNSDKTILVDSNGTAITSQRSIRLDGADALNLKAGTYVICGIPEGISGEIYINNSTNTVNIVSTTTHAPKVFTVNSDYDNVIIGVVVKPNQPAVSNKVFKPMITTDLNATYDDYVPHAKNNRELTEIVRGAVIQHAVTITPNTNEKWSSILARVKTAVDSYIASLGISGIRFRTIEIVGDGRYFLPLNQVFDTSFYNGIYTSTRIDGTYFAECDIMLNANGGTYKWFLVSSAGVTTMSDKSNENAGTMIVYLELLSPNIIQNN